MSADGIARILVIDDEPQIRKFLRISLNAYGYEVVEAVRGEEGIGKCATASPDLVILDLACRIWMGRRSSHASVSGPRSRSSCSRSGRERPRR